MLPAVVFMASPVATLGSQFRFYGIIKSVAVYAKCDEASLTCRVGFHDGKIPTIEMRGSCIGATF